MPRAENAFRCDAHTSGAGGTKRICRRRDVTRCAGDKKERASLFGRRLHLSIAPARYHPRMAQRKKPQIREAILAAAFRLFSRNGYAATMVADIAREAGVSPGNVYIYFRSKLEILYAI